MFENNVSEFYLENSYSEDCVENLKKMLSAWAKMLESNPILKNNSLNVFHMLKLSLASFDPNIYEEIQKDMFGLNSPAINTCLEDILAPYDMVRLHSRPVSD